MSWFEWRWDVGEPEVEANSDNVGLVSNKTSKKESVKVTSMKYVGGWVGPLRFHVELLTYHLNQPEPLHY